MRDYRARYHYVGRNIFNNHELYPGLTDWWKFRAKDDNHAITLAEEHKPDIPEHIKNPAIKLESLYEHRKVSLKR